ncbi:helix-turn-helix transcriptional regulator [Agarivorans sp. MS3-6]
MCQEIYGFIQKSLGTPQCCFNFAVKDLNLHPKAIQRELKRNGLSFKGILAETRKEVAEYYLAKTKMSFIQLSQLLGYNNPSAFSRAFKCHSGITPKQYREKQIECRDDAKTYALK